MRKLTLDEKISFKGLFAKKGIVNIPTLNIIDALHFWKICFGYVKANGNYFNLNFRKEV